MDKKTRVQAPQPSVAEMDEHIKLLAFAAIWIIIAAAVVFVLVPRGTPLQNCMHALVSANKEQCLYTLALSSKNASLCANLTNYDANSCYFTIAEAGDNQTMCTKITDANSSAQCVDFVANATDRFSDCYALSGTSEQSCLETMALKDHNSTLCLTLGSPFGRGVCSSSISFGDALRLKNLSYCSAVTPSLDENITSTVLVDSGAFNYGKVASNLSGYIALMAFSPAAAQFSAHDLCYLSYAAEYGNSSACATISNSTLGSSCYAINSQSRQANSTANSINYTQLLDTCSTQTSQQNQTSCVSVIRTIEALDTKNVSLCGTLQLNYSYECYTSFASRFTNSTYCGYIKNYTVYNACLQNAYFNSTAAANGTATYP